MSLGLKATAFLAVPIIFPVTNSTPPPRDPCGQNVDSAGSTVPDVMVSVRHDLLACTD
ncbi:uncharacterized protein DEA37_0012203, partial [Paragonimus westermani]